MTTVINIRTCPDFNPKSNPNDVYIGSYYPGKPFFPASRWRNPFKVGQDGTREGAIEKYRQYILQKPRLLAQIPDLKGKRLGCWCKPKACHGDLLAAWADNGIPPIEYAGDHIGKSARSEPTREALVRDIEGKSLEEMIKLMYRLGDDKRQKSL